MTVGLTLEVVWFDEQLIELRAAASNGKFAGETTFYERHSAFKDLARTLSGFPDGAGDARQHLLGNPDSRADGGGVSLNFATVDAIGHCGLTVTLTSWPKGEAGPPSIAEFLIPIEPQAVDSFVSTLSELNARSGRSAHLSGSAA